MKKPLLFRRTLIALALSGAWLFSSAQSASEVSPPIKATVYHWHRMHRDAKLSSATESEYSNLPEASYTPPQNIAEWSAASALQSYASSLSNKKVSALFIFTIDEKGFVRKLKVIKTTDKSITDALSALILNTKISGPSYLQNQAVASYLPCSISIEKNHIIIL